MVADAVIEGSSGQIVGDLMFSVKDSEFYPKSQKKPLKDISPDIL